MQLKKNTLVLLLSLFVIPSGGLAQNLSELAKKIAAEIVDCHDGDTCHVLLSSGMSLNVRLAGIDAPEVGRYGKSQSGGQELGDASRNALVSLVVKKKNTYLRQVDIDRYNRPVVEIFVDNELINLKMLEIGMAERYTGMTIEIDRAKYEAAETKSKNLKLGIWGISHYVSPKKWRREDKK